MVQLSLVEKGLESQRQRTIAADEARSLAQEFLLRNMKDSLTAGPPSLLIVDGALAWRAPILFTQPGGALGEVGEILLVAESGEVMGWTPSAEVYRNARALLTS